MLYYCIFNLKPVFKAINKIKNQLLNFINKYYKNYLNDYSLILISVKLCKQIYQSNSKLFYTRINY